jgi:hypothetical protein
MRPLTVLVLALFIPLVALCAMRPVQRGVTVLTSWLARVARRQWLALSVVFIIALLSMALPSILGSMPVPAIHDEFAYLLAADTFAHGRMTNPTHRHWPHFETFHVIHQPSYSSKFPPGQGLALALGQVLWCPLLGAWLSTAAACAASAWMLRPRVGPTWALLGGILASLHQTVHWWSQSYWGGAVAMLGGALLGGGAARLLHRRPRAAHAILLTLGVAILAISRPFEGLITTLIVAVFLAIDLLRRFDLARLLRRIILPAALVLVPSAGALGYYNWRITRSATTMPYVVHQQKYMVAPLFHWQSTRPVPDYRHEVLRRFFLYDELPVHEKQQALAGFLDEARTKIIALGRAYLQPPLLALPLVVAIVSLFTARGRRGWKFDVLALLVCVLLPLAHMLLTPWMRIQYMAPALPFLMALIIVGMRRMISWKTRGISIGSAIVAAIFVAHVIAGIAWAVEYNRREQLEPGRARAALVRYLEEQPGRDLVLVRYAPSHSPNSEWVFNAADIDASPIVFARAISPDEDQSLIDYFDDRHVWLLTVEAGNVLEFRRVK